MHPLIDNHTNRIYPITLIGEILVDEIYNNRTGEESVLFGGSPANIALNLIDLGLRDVQFAGAVGDDEFGDLLLKNISNNHLSTVHITTTQHNTTVVKIDQTESTPIPTFYRGSDYHITMTDNLRHTIAASSILHFSYWPLSQEPARSTIKEAISIAKDNNVLVGFDPNYHPLLDEENDFDRQEIIEIIQQVDVIKPSLDDAKRIFGGNESAESYLQRFADLGVKLVVMTLGKDGLLCQYQDQIIALPSMATEVVDVTGAGDAFLSGLYSALLHQENLETTLKMGLVCSAYNLKQVGGRSYLPTYEVLRQQIK